MKKSVYISGPITGVENYWEPFEDIQDYIDAKGCIGLSPTWMPNGLERWKYMRMSIAMVDAADAVVLLPGWYEHAGCRLEEAYARECGKPILYDAEQLDEFLEDLKHDSDR